MLKKILIATLLLHSVEPSIAFCGQKGATTAHPHSLKNLIKKALVFMGAIGSSDALKPPQSRPHIKGNQTFPYASAWQIAQPTDANSRLLLNWTAAGDSLYPFYKNLPPLKPTFPFGSYSTPSQVVPFTGFGTLDYPAQMQVGIQDSRHYFTSWPLISTYAYFGGSHSEGQVLAPAPGWIRAAHRSGAKILGSVFFSTDPSEGEWVQQFLTQGASGNFPYAQKLIEIARAYHFDGYFINEESVEGDPRVNAQFVQFFKYFHTQANDLLLSWYQVPAYSVDTTFIQDPKSRSNLPFFLDYSGFDNLEAWVNATDQVDCPRSVLSFGVNAETATKGEEQRSFFTPLTGPYGNYSLSIFDLPQIILDDTSKDPLSSVAAQLMQNYWEGDSNWEGVRTYVSRTSAIQDLPFSTEFSTGFGERFFKAGKLAFEAPWNALELQDYLPTQQFDIHQNRSNLTVAYNFTDAYSAGNSLQYQGNLVENEEVRSGIFATQLLLGTNNQLEITYKSTSPSASICVALASGNSSCYRLTNSDQNWTTEMFSLASFAGQTVQSISLRILSATNEPHYNLELGRLYIGQAIPDPTIPSHFQLIGQPGQDESGNWHVYATWDFNSEIAYYNLYTRNATSDQLTFILRTSNNVVDFGGEARLPIAISIEAVNGRGGASAMAEMLLPRI